MNTAPHDEPPKPSLKKLGGALVGLLEGHFELLGIEFQEEKARSLQLFLVAGLGLVLALLILVGLSTAVIIFFWDTYRIGAILGLCAVYTIALIICIARAIKLARECANPFQATLEELARNREQLLP
ncbi:phage holin family protein [Azomonas macrocytogenes]|uniref:Putative membrane protein YqjE n=1 Tax=Azomonas macrocytogenes TaxID=69962 RepID=A0A839SW87_AZOMA|nr:phage holin family protein [Azomonas macrocytogenes]MBB3101661.1 putative membrane protein YqjE [Azomonas macrocytogenes]